METSVMLQDFSAKNGEGNNTGIVENPILNAARNGNAAEIRRLLQLKNVETHRPLYPRDWQYTFKNLCEKDSDGRTALHLAAAVGDPKMSLDCVMALLETVQLMVNEKEWPNYIKKYAHFVNLTDRNGETALHLAIENRASDVAAYLLSSQGNMLAKNRKGVEALRLIYENLPEAMTQLYDESIQLTPDCKGLEIKWGTIVGFNQTPSESRDSSGNNSGQAGGKLVPDPGLWIESKNLKYVLNSDKWGARILTHPLIKLYLEQKWEKIQWFFWVAFTLEVIWLLLYAAAFVTLHVERRPRENGTGESTPPNDNGSSEVSSSSSGYLILWLVMAVFTIICALKDVYQVLILRKAYFSFENVLRDVFIVLVIAQVALLIMSQPEIVMTTSVVGIILGTMLMIFQLGKTPYFGLQVAAWKKVMFSFAPHVPVFFTWFAGFGLIFWAILFKAEESWLVGMVAIMAAMGTGELNAEEHLKPDDKDAEVTVLRECVRAFAILFFVILIVTLYFNLLIGYAVTDIQILKEKAKALQLSNKLSTIYTIESFLLSGLGRVIIRLKGYLGSCLPFLFQNKSHNSVHSIYIIPPRDFNSCQGKGTLEFSAISHKLRNMLSKIAYENKEKKEKELQRMQEKVLELLGICSADVNSDRSSNQ